MRGGPYQRDERPHMRGSRDDFNIAPPRYNMDRQMGPNYYNEGEGPDQRGPPMRRGRGDFGGPPRGRFDGPPMNGGHPGGRYNDDFDR